jgi:hypothetical protein
MRRYLKGEQGVSWFGVRYPGWKQDRKQLDDVEIIAKQWGIACRKARYDLGAYVPSEQWMEVRYEDIVSAPAKWIRRICSFAGLQASDDLLRRAKEQIHDSSTERWKEVLRPTQLERANPYMQDTLSLLGYTEE